jgi:hypothetical protein
VAIEMSIRRAEREGARLDAEALPALRDLSLATLPSTHALRTEVDAEAILEGKGYACRPGCRVKTSPTVMNIIAAAL